jgi:Domain of unknown function (DUF6894)
LTRSAVEAFKSCVPHFYFTVNDHWGEALDDEGAELLDIEAALLHAAAGVRSMMGDSINGRGLLDLSGSVEIEDEHRAVVARLPFRDAIKIRE